MLICQDRVYRNLQEQVVKNMEDIEFILKQRGVLNEYGLRIVEVADSLPSVSDYKTAHSGWAYGDTFLVGDEEPYEAYILTKANGSHLTDYWLDLGEIPVAGPQGEQGPAGTFNSVAVSVGANVGTPTVTVTYSGGDVAFAFDNIKGDKGDPGEQGPEGPEGPAGGTEVIANPTIAGTETALTSIQIDDTKYKVGGGNTLYTHTVFVGGGFSTFVNASSIPYTNNTLAASLYSKGFTGTGLTTIYPVSGYPVKIGGSSSTQTNQSIGVYSPNGTALRLAKESTYYDFSNGKISAATITYNADGGDISDVVSVF